MNRREFLLASLGSSLLIIPGLTYAKGISKNSYMVTDEFWDQPRKLNLYREQTEETIDLTYWENGTINYANYQKICTLLRDISIGKSHEIDIKLLNLLCGVQAWLRASGYAEPLIVHSGYRTPYTNERTEGAAKNSYHLRGKAVDFSVKNLTANKALQLAKKFEVGGVGFYPSRDFIHVDTGDVRYWEY